MIVRNLKHLVEDVDRHGNVRIYLRRPGFKKVRLHEMPGTSAFLDEYRAALRTAEATCSPKTVSPTAPGSFRRLCQLYMGSPEYLGLDGSTRNWRRRALEAVCEAHGSKPFAALDAKAVRLLRDELATKPGSANNRLKALKALFAWAVEAQEAKSNPTRDVRLIRYYSAGHLSWKVEHIAKFEACHKLGTKARLAMALLLYTACRREDAPRLGPQHVKGGRIRFVQGKNEHRRPVVVEMPITPELQEALDAMPSQHSTFLTTDYGKPFSAAGFGNKFREWCDAAGLKGYSAHGLRKAMATLLAENDATAHQIGAVTGHSSLREIERYTQAAQRPRLATEAFAKFNRRIGSGTQVSHSSQALSVPPRNS